MKANELRIGNLVTQIIHKNTHDQEIEIKVNWQEIWWISKGTNSYKPIPLTEEWLLKFGFEKYEFDHKENQYRHKDRLIVFRDGKFVDYGSSVILEYVHQLQNLYFALTGEELVLKP